MTVDDGKQTVRRDGLGQIPRRDGKQIPSSRLPHRFGVSKGGAGIGRARRSDSTMPIWLQRFRYEKRLRPISEAATLIVGI